MRRRTFISSAVATAASLSIPRHFAFGAAWQQATPQQGDLDAITGDGQQITLRGQAISDLRARLRGRLLLPGNDGYDQARRILNPSFDKRPALIVQPTGVADIRTAVNFARDNRGLLLAVKCGGHSFSGQSTCDRGMMIDLSLFRAVHVDPKARVARVTGGTLLGYVDVETAPYDLVTPLGTVSHTGVGGLVTGGGFGRVARKFGLSIDNLLAVDIVTADGEWRHASRSENADLFWGVRGGGGNFGIVTDFQFQLHPMQRNVIAGQIMYPIARAREVLTVFGDYMRTAPDELTFDAVMAQPPGGAPGVAGFPVCYCGPASGAERALAPLRRLGTPLVDDVKAMPYVAVQRSGDIADPRALAVYLKSGFVNNITPDFVSAVVDGFRADPSRMSTVVLVPGGGAISRVAANSTAFVHRDAIATMLVVAGWPSATDGSAHVQYGRQYFSQLERFTSGFYVNDVAIDATAATIAANYKSNLDRLVAAKNKYDPKNLFRLNANVRPTV